VNFTAKKLRIRYCKNCKIGIGGQKGHKKHECKEVAAKRQIAFVEKLFVVTEYHDHSYACSVCQTTHTASAPKEKPERVIFRRVDSIGGVSERALSCVIQGVTGIFPGCSGDSDKRWISCKTDKERRRDA
jgi:hypothetical protein